MKPLVLLATAALAASLPFQAGESLPPPSMRTPPVMTGAPELMPSASEPPHTAVEPGDVAPNFSYQAEDGRWLRLSDLTAQGHVLLVFGPDDDALRTLQSERNELLDLGVLPVAVVALRSGAARTKAKRLALSYPVLADSRGVIAEQFNLTDPVRRTAMPSWFVLDRERHVRGLLRGNLPEAGFPRLSATVLAIPMKGASQPASRR